MHQLVILNLGKGNLQQGFAGVTAQVWQGENPVPMQFVGALPPRPELEILNQNWHKQYFAFYSSLNWRHLQRDNRLLDFEIDETDVTHISKAEFSNLCQDLQRNLNDWLNADSFRPIDQKLRTRLIPQDEMRVIITAASRDVLTLPWCLWHFLEDYPKAEIALSPPEFSRSEKVLANPTGQVRILAILGNSQGINVGKDRQILEQISDAQLTFLAEPDRAELDQHLWEAGWDVIFFAGHSSSQGKGRIQLNQTDSLTIDQLRYGLKRAIARGLQLAIFNSCDGLGLAWDLSDLHLPQVIVMREPVPDRVAQEFLKHFITAFSGGQSLYGSVREAREKLQVMEDNFPCSTWLPVICQNPAEVSPTWQVLKRTQAAAQTKDATVEKQERVLRSKPYTQSKLSDVSWRILSWILGASTIATSLVVGVRWLGMLQPLELWAFDHLMRLRPAEESDPRLLVITITENDIQAQGTETRRSSLSDRSFSQLLTKLEKYQVAAIGLDIYRDFPVSSTHPELAKQMKFSDRLFTICKRPDPESDPTGILPPPEIPGDRLGFSDFVEDTDGVLRRHLLSMSPNPISPCTPANALSVQLAFHYLKAKGIATGFTSEGDLKLGDQIFQRLKDRTVGYQPVDADGIQLMLNYRAPLQQIAQQVTLTQFLKGQINPDAVKDRIVLIGITSPNSGDEWSTTYGSGYNDRVPGVFLHAQMVSQLLSAALDHRPIIWALPEWGEIAWIWVWSVTGGLIIGYVQRLSYRTIAGGFTFIIFTGICFLILIKGGWLPLVPCLLASTVAAAQIAYISRMQKQI